MDDDRNGYVYEFEEGIYTSENTVSVFPLFPNPANGEFEVCLQLNKERNTEVIVVVYMRGECKTISST